MLFRILILGPMSRSLRDSLSSLKHRKSHHLSSTHTTSPKPFHDTSNLPSPVRSPLKVLNQASSDVQCSPLTVRSTDSPRMMMQKKQMSKINRLKVKCQVKTVVSKGSPHAKYTVFNDDKENM